MDKIIYSIGLGPGDYEMMTLKAKRILEESDIIYLSGGKIFNGFDQVKELLSNISCDHKLVFYEFPENKSTTDKINYNEQFVRDTAQKLNEGKKICYVTMGDISIYSSFPDLYNELNKIGIKLIGINGIPSTLAPSTLTGTAMVEWREKATIMPCPDNKEEIEKVLTISDNIFIMKINDKGKVIFDFLKSNNVRTAVAAFNAYTEKQAVVDLLKEKPNDDLDFFMSVVMIKK